MHALRSLLLLQIFTFNLELKFNLQWEIDVWGRLAHLQKAAGFDNDSTTSPLKVVLSGLL